jgi:hypothetical protein
MSSRSYVWVTNSTATTRAAHLLAGRLIVDRRRRSGPLPGAAPRKPLANAVIMSAVTPDAEDAWPIQAGYPAKVQDAHRTVFEIEERMLSEITPGARRRLNETLHRLVENLGTS